jgi:hypothetical protein
MVLEGARLASRYELLRDVSSDGEAEMWEADDTVLERRVVVKVLRPGLSDDSAAVERFTSAARASARAHAQPGQRVLDAGRDVARGLPFVVFEWPGPTVSEVAAPPARTTRATPRPRPRVESTPRRRSVNPRIMLPLLLVPIVAGVILVRGLLDLPSPRIAINDPAAIVLPTAVAAAPAPTSAPARAPAAAPTATSAPRPAQVQPTAAPSPTGTARRRVVNTDGQGVALRDGPNGNRLPGKGYDEGATVTVLEQNGAWTHIRGDDGREGWVLTVTLG